MRPEARPALWRQACYGPGMVSIYAVTQTSLTYLVRHLFMATTQVQQFVLHDLGRFLVALSWPGVALKEGVPTSCLRLFAEKTRFRRSSAFSSNPLLRLCCSSRC
jgi:putative membrane protein